MNPRDIPRFEALSKAYLGDLAAVEIYTRDELAASLTNPTQEETEVAEERAANTYCDDPSDVYFISRNGASFVNSSLNASTYLVKGFWGYGFFMALCATGPAAPVVSAGGSALFNMSTVTVVAANYVFPFFGNNIPVNLLYTSLYKHRWTLLHYAAAGNRLNVVQYLISKNANTNALNARNETFKQVGRLFGHAAFEDGGEVDRYISMKQNLDTRRVRERTNLRIVIDAGITRNAALEDELNIRSIATNDMVVRQTAILEAATANHDAIVNNTLNAEVRSILKSQANKSPEPNPRPTDSKPIPKAPNNHSFFLQPKGDKADLRKRYIQYLLMSCKDEAFRKKFAPEIKQAALMGCDEPGALPNVMRTAEYRDLIKRIDDASIKNMRPILRACNDRIRASDPKAKVRDLDEMKMFFETKVNQTNHPDAYNEFAQNMKNLVEPVMTQLDEYVKRQAICAQYITEQYANGFYSEVSNQMLIFNEVLVKGDGWCALSAAGITEPAAAIVTLKANLSNLKVNNYIAKSIKNNLHASIGLSGTFDIPGVEPNNGPPIMNKIRELYEDCQGVVDPTKNPLPNETIDNYLKLHNVQTSYLDYLLSVKWTDAIIAAAFLSLQGKELALFTNHSLPDGKLANSTEDGISPSDQNTVCVVFHPNASQGQAHYNKLQIRSILSPEQFNATVPVQETPITTQEPETCQAAPPFQYPTTPAELLQLGITFQQGRGGIPVDTAKAMECFKRGAALESDNPVLIYYYLISLPENEREPLFERLKLLATTSIPAREYLNIYYLSSLHLKYQAVPTQDPKYSNALVWLGCAYHNAWGVPQDLARAHAYFSQAHNLQNKSGTRNLGLHAEHGYNGPINKRMALHYYRMAMDQDETARSHYNRLLPAYRQAALQGDSSAQAGLAASYLEGNATERSDIEACVFLELLAARGAVEVEAKRKLILAYHRRADAGEMQIQFKLGMMYRHGEDVEQNVIEAFRLLNLAAAGGNYTANHHVGLMYQFGVATDINLRLARDHFARAYDAGRGHAPSQIAHSFMQAVIAAQDAVFYCVPCVANNVASFFGSSNASHCESPAIASQQIPSLAIAQNRSFFV